MRSAITVQIKRKKIKKIKKFGNAKPPSTFSSSRYDFLIFGMDLLQIEDEMLLSSSYKEKIL